VIAVNISHRTFLLIAKQRAKEIHFLNKSLLAFSALLFGLNLSAATLPKQSFNLSYNDYSDGDYSIGGMSIYGRKTLLNDSLSLKLNYQDLSIEDNYQDQINNAPSYSEKQSIIATGVDYLYYDSILSLNSSYTSAESTKEFALALDVSQEYNNGASAILLGFQHHWEDDGDLGLHNKNRSFHIGRNFTIRPTWVMYTGFKFASADGDLENFQSARRFNDKTRTNLPSGRSDQLLQIISSNDLRKGLFLNTTLDFSRNDWGQSGNNLELDFLRVRSEKLSVKTLFRLSKLDESSFFLDSVVSPSQTFYSDHRYLAKQDTKEFGLTGQWKLKSNSEKRLNNFRLDLGYSFIKHDYLTAQKISNSGHLLHLNFSGNY
jgi:hypothetical protein